jgi:hypothetical protein
MLKIPSQNFKDNIAAKMEREPEIIDVGNRLYRENKSVAE